MTTNLVAYSNHIYRLTVCRSDVVAESFTSSFVSGSQLGCSHSNGSNGGQQASQTLQVISRIHCFVVACLKYRFLDGDSSELLKAIFNSLPCDKQNDLNCGFNISSAKDPCKWLLTYHVSSPKYLFLFLQFYWEIFELCLYKC